MNPRLRTLSTVAVAGLALLGGFLAGYADRAWSVPAAGGGEVVLSITAAGSMAGLLPPIASEFANATPDVSAPAAAQQYQGSLAALTAVTTLGERFDVAATADYRLIPQLMEPRFATWEVIFAADPVVLAFDPSVPAFHALNGTNWPDALPASGTRLGVASAAVDPMGYNAIFVLELEGLRESGNLSAVYHRYYSGAPGALATPDPATTRLAPESEAAALLASHTVGAFFVYRSYALTSHLAFVALPPSVDLGETNGSAIALYNQSGTTITTSQGSEVVRGAPVLFAATVPTNAPHPFEATLFLAYLLSPHVRGEFASDGFSPLAPAWSDAPGQLPTLLAGLCTPLPPALAGNGG